MLQNIYVIRENDENITSRDTMENAVAAAINRMVICGYLCEGIDYDENVTIISYRDLSAHVSRVMFVEAVRFKEGI